MRNDSIGATGYPVGEPLTNRQDSHARFFSNKTTHPLADAREAKRILAEIAARGPQAAIEDARVWLESLAADDSFKLGQRLVLTFRLDEAALAQARRLGRDYPALGRARRAQDSQQWQLGHDYWQRLAAGYLDCLARYRAPEKDADAIRTQLPLLYGRLISALANRIKWDQFRYRPVDPECWLTLGSIYLAAVDTKVAQKPLQLYSGGGESTIEAEYLKVLVFHAASMDNLQPLEIEIAERLIACFLPFFSLSRELLPGTVYWVDAAKPLPPTRFAKAPEITPTVRFFNGACAVEAFAKITAQIQSKGRVPPDIELGAQYKAETMIAVLEHLALCWASKPPMRSDTRRRINSPLRVANGLATAYQILSERTSGNEGIETWLTDNVSLGGLGAQATISPNDWIRIGVLVALQPDGGDNWLIGIVRRYVRTEPNHGSVGIQTISKTPRAVFADANGLWTEAILLDLPEVGDCARMALPPDAFEDGMALVFVLDDKSVRLHPREIIETGPDYVVANFFVQSYS